MRETPFSAVSLSSSITDYGKLGNGAEPACHTHMLGLVAHHINGDVTSSNSGLLDLTSSSLVV